MIDRKHVCMGLGIMLLTGCYSRVRPEVDGLVCASAHRPVDMLIGEASAKPPQGASNSADKLPSFDPVIPVAAFQQAPNEKDKQAPTIVSRLKVPAELPGAEVPPFRLPDVRTNPEEYKAAIKRYFPPLAPLGPELQPAPGPNGRPMTLTELQFLARTNSPLLRQAGADLAAAKGAATQAGAYPNPIVGVQSATASNTGGPSYGVFVGQTITTMGKKKLAEAAAIMDLENAQLAYQRAETDLMAAVRSGYFAVLVAQESVKANRALVNLTDEVYKVNVDLVVIGGEAAPYEPMQVAVFAGQARAALYAARTSYLLAWKQLVTRLGVRGMPPTALEGRIDMPLPKYEYASVLAHVLARHTEVATAANTERKARFNLQLAEVTAIPDVTVQTTLTNDNSLGVSNRVVAGVQASVPVPVWDRNRGAIQQAQGNLMRAVEEAHRVQNDLTSRVADAFSRYDLNRVSLELYRVDILPKQVQAFRAAVARHYIGEKGQVAYTDLIASEQNLVSVIAPYITTLGAQWQAVVDVANLLQTEDLFQTGGVYPVAPLPDLEQLLRLPCCHPCSPLPGSTVANPDDYWPSGGFTPTSPAQQNPALTPKMPALKENASVQPPLATSSMGASRQVGVGPLTPRLGTPRLVEPSLIEN